MAHTLRSLDELSEILNSKGHVKFLECIKNAIKEWNKNEGAYVSCEFSTRGEDLDIKMEYLYRLGRDTLVNNGYFTIGFCDTCFGHHGYSGPFHIQIERHPN